jgi:hypothetical protein
MPRVFFYLVVVVVRGVMPPPASGEMQTKLLGGTHVIVLSLQYSLPWLQNVETSEEGRGAGE